MAGARNNCYSLVISLHVELWIKIKHLYQGHTKAISAFTYSLCGFRCARIRWPPSFQLSLIHCFLVKELCTCCVFLKETPLLLLLFSG
jgi:diacylglycerol kinase